MYGVAYGSGSSSSYDDNGRERGSDVGGFSSCTQHLMEFGW